MDDSDRSLRAAHLALISKALDKWSELPFIELKSQSGLLVMRNMEKYRFDIGLYLLVMRLVTSLELSKDLLEIVLGVQESDATAESVEFFSRRIDSVIQDGSVYEGISKLLSEFESPVTILQGYSVLINHREFIDDFWIRSLGKATGSP